MRYTTNDGQEVGVGKTAAVGAVVGLGLILLCGLLIGSCKSLDSTGPTQVAVVHNGGPFDNKGPREVVGSSSGYKVPGLASSWHKYIEASEQRFYTISPDAGADSNAVVTVPTKDGVQVTITGTTNFHTVFTGAGATAEECQAADLPDDCQDVALWNFDQAFGNRTYDGHRIYDGLGDGDEGWSAFLAAQFEPVLVSTFREEIGQLECADLVSSCALIQQGAAASDGANLTIQEQDNTATFQKVQDAVQAKLVQRMDTALGGHYLDDFQVQIRGVTLPEAIQGEIDTAQGAFAQIATQRANAQAAEFQARQAQLIVQQYGRQGAAAIKMAETLKDSSATIILGSGFGLNVGGK